MATIALTHHEIVELVEPFARRGRHVDLAASDRSARKLVFKAIATPGTPGALGAPGEPATAPAVPSLHETLTMDCHDDGRFIVERTVTHASGLRASLQAAGPQPGELLASIEAIAPSHHFRFGEGFVIARSYEFWSPGAGDTRFSASQLFLSHAVAQVDGLSFVLTQRLPRWKNVAGEITLTPASGARFDLPEDLLAVLGWDWARLVRKPEGWASKLRLRGNALRRSRTAEVALEQAAQHLVRNFAEAPARFHERHWLARWGVVFRRGIPSLTALSLLAGAVSLVFFADPGNAGAWMALHYVPVVLLALAFSLQELPQFEIPPWPRRSPAKRWRESSEGYGG
jgi:hypothetical protein